MVALRLQPSNEITISPEGEICADTLAPFQHALHDAVAVGAGDVVIDLRNVTLLSAAAMGLVAQTCVRLRNEQRRLRVVRPAPFVERCLSIAGLEVLLDH